MRWELVLATLVMAWPMGPGRPAASSDTDAGPVTFYQDVLPILQENCQQCHRPNGANLRGMVAPMAFVTYDETRPWAKSMARAVESRKMPPWHADARHHGVFENERTLEQREIDALVAWARTGASPGNPATAPAARSWPTGTDNWSIGEPDLVLQPDAPYFVADDVGDAYVYLKTTVTDEQLPADRYIKAVEFRPGSSVVHHIITTPLGGIAPGNDPTTYPAGIGALFEKGTDLTWEMHYHKEPGPGTGVWDHSSVAIQFYERPEEVRYLIQGNELGRYDFAIPPGEPEYTLQQEYTFAHDSRIVALMPHFHLRGKAARYQAFYPDGREEVLLEVPRYDFNWQTNYQYAEFKAVPKGTKIVFTSVWDNSTDNPYNPDPTATVRYGEPTTDEMSFGFMSFINDSGEHEGFYDSLEEDDIDLTAVVAFSDVSGDGRMQEAEAPEELRPFFAFIDADRDGAIDMAEARATNSLREESRGACSN